MDKLVHVEVSRIENATVSIAKTDEKEGCPFCTMLDDELATPLPEQTVGQSETRTDDRSYLLHEARLKGFNTTGTGTLPRMVVSPGLGEASYQQNQGGAIPDHFADKIVQVEELFAKLQRMIEHFLETHQSPIERFLQEGNLTGLGETYGLSRAEASQMQMIYEEEDGTQVTINVAQVVVSRETGMRSSWIDHIIHNRFNDFIFDPNALEYADQLLEEDNDPESWIFGQPFFS
ncbi:hypothetical protein ACQZV8_03110 [Magnetococcales bacterium HHB-1]